MQASGSHYQYAGHWNWFQMHDRFLLSLLPIFLFYSWDLHKKEATMVFEALCMSFPYIIQLLLYNYAKVNAVFHTMAPLK